ncbi:MULTISPECIES: hypothetical protein [Nostoc]|uniref:Uncharacterized protein n=1 Tax=Nostoc paludosum FACHB-159 TaxID=2692908 RepID=A0ABR8KH63_9NOSO|nr:MULTISPECIES: hypothetical protein [Nostoc]MBD2737640.1 hypothetical protein [Nostoc paludosum FACHB-159]
MPNTSLREAAPTTTLRTSSVQVPNTSLREAAPTAALSTSAQCPIFKAGLVNRQRATLFESVCKRKCDGSYFSYHHTWAG